MSTLFLVATPIGNLGDLSKRAIETLRDVSLIAVEDTRHTAKLLNHFEIKTPMTSYFEHNKSQKLKKVMEVLSGGDVAIVSDAGTPALNDPGYLLVQAALEAGHQVSPIPGPSAPIAALVVSGLPTDRFLYLGYLPRKQQERIQALQEIVRLPYTVIFFETPHRMQKSLADMYQVLGDRNISIAGELTKKFEKIFRGNITEAIDHFESFPARGEYTVVVAGKIKGEAKWSIEELELAIKQQLADGVSTSSIAKFLVVISGWKRREIYQYITNLQKDRE